MVDHVVQAEGGPVFAEEFVDTIVEPAPIAKLEDPLQIVRCSPQESLQAIGVGAPTRRELDEDGAESRTEAAGSIHETPNRLARLLQVLEVGPVAAELQRVPETARRLLTPRIEDPPSGQIVGSFRV
jgi:hypothetical protein